MIRAFLVGLGAIWVMTGVYIFVDPMGFYEAVPGLQLMGPFNMHFIRDVGLAFIASGGALAWGGFAEARALALAGIAWPSLHALFHIQIWSHRGFPFDNIFAFDLFAVIGPPAFALLAVLKLGRTQDSKR